MNLEQRQVEEFHRKIGKLIPTSPKWPHDLERELRVRLIQEELDELKEALTLIDVADAVGDLLYVVLGTAVEYGIDIDPVFQAIHKSNMTKFIDGYMREDGKWMKGPSYIPVDLDPILEKQIPTDV